MPTTERTHTERPRAFTEAVDAAYTTDEMAALFRMSRSGLYVAVREGRFPIEPIRVSRKMLFPKRKVDALLGIGGDAGHGGA